MQPRPLLMRVGKDKQWYLDARPFCRLMPHSLLFSGQNYLDRAGRGMYPYTSRLGCIQGGLAVLYGFVWGPWPTPR